MKKTTVLVTGVTGFLGSHVTIQLLNRGYAVVGTLRDMQRADAIRQTIAKHTDQVADLRFVEADLLKADWDTILQGIDFVQHIASPFPQVLPKNEDDLIRPAKEGALKILKAAKRNGVKRVVLTSSVGAVSYGKTPAQLQAVFDEGTWTDIDNRKDTTPYFRSKTIAEQAAWDYVRGEGKGMELVTICPGGILGPLLEQDFSASVNIVLKCLDGSVPAVPQIGFEVIDVRSVADLHILAMEKPNAVGQRYIASAGYMRFMDVAQLLRKHYPKRKIPRIALPNFVARLFSYIDKTLKPILVDLGVHRKVNATKAQRELGWQPLSKEEAVLACAKSAFELGLLRP
jgi:dihydroflavonol-4-reductase